ncbi:MAG: hypothetical protein II837_07400 [Treponema sp.]|nr:hypothetical protein [Treponema sp.]MBQ6568531.1 hypothetical protein [Treponema sp.]
MADNSDLVGHKVFFVGADAGLIPDVFLEDLIIYGIESYRIHETSTKAMLQKLELTAQLFPPSVFFFYIDLPLEGLQWSELILKFLKNHQAESHIGIMYTRRSMENERLAIERLYNAMKIDCGFIPLNLRRAQNFPFILQHLDSCGVRGQRKHIRVQCGPSSTATFFIREAGRRIPATMMDFSMNHFSCIINEDIMPPYDTYEDVLIQANGLRFRTDCKKIMERDSEVGKLFVFVFLQKDGTTGLEDDTRFKVQSKIYELSTEETKNMQQEAFSEFLKRKRDGISLEALCTQAVQEVRLNTDKHQSSVSHP